MGDERGYTSPEILTAMYRYRRAGIVTLVLAGLLALLSFLISTGWLPSSSSMEILLPCLTVWFIAVALYAFFRSAALMSTAIQNMDRSAMMRLERMARSTDPGSSHDYLYLKARLDEEKARVDRHGGVMSLLYMEVADYDELKGNFGEKVCEEVLDQMADMFSSHLRQFDALRRIHPNRYLVLLPQTSRRDARTVAESLMKVVEEYSYVQPAGGRVEDLSVSIGVAAYPINGDSTENVVSAAHSASQKARELSDKKILVSEQFIRTDSSGEQIIAEGHEQPG